MHKPEGIEHPKRFFLKKRGASFKHLKAALKSGLISLSVIISCADARLLS